MYVCNLCVCFLIECVCLEFLQLYFGVIFVIDVFCDKDGCEGCIVVSEKYWDNKKGGRLCEDFVMGFM